MFLRIEWLFLWVVGGSIVLYLLPALIALLVRDTKHAAGVFALNLFLGWTVIGWVAAMVWAVIDPPLPKDDEWERESA